MTKYIFDHPQMTSEQRRAGIKRLIDAGLPLGASHNWSPHPGAQTLAMGTLMKANEYGNYKPGDVVGGYGKRPPRKHIGDHGRVCSGKDTHCMDGKGGKCVLCDNHD